MREHFFESLESRTMLAGDVVLEWNNLALEAVKLDHGVGAPHLQAGPGPSSRALAIVQGAIFDAVNAITKKYTPWIVSDVRAVPGASVEAAAAQAGHDTLISLYPYLSSMFDQALANNLKHAAPGSAKLGAKVGKAVAAEVLAARANDHSNDPMDYTPGTLPGQWRPDPLHPAQMALGPKWGDVTPFGMLNASQFQIPAPPALTSADYASAYQEVKSLGGDGVTTPTARTAEQTEIGIYWGYDGTPGLGTPPRLYNQIAQVIAKQEHNSVIENARLFALVNFAMADAGIACWNDKFTHNFWRPVTAIRENDSGTGPSGLGSGNPALVGAGDPNWTPLEAPNDNGGGTNFTPPFPAYASGHATFGAALFETLADFYGTDNIHFSFTSDEFNGITKDQNGITRPVVTRSFDSFSDAAEENGQSRIYLGIHWRFDKEQGIACGDHIADYNFAHMLQPVTHAPARGVVFTAASAAPGGTSSTDPTLPGDTGSDGFWVL